jgi:signal transduction histidine kinase
MSSSTAEKSFLFGLPKRDFVFSIIIIFFFIVCFTFIYKIAGDKLSLPLNDDGTKILIYFQIAVLSALVIGCFYCYQLLGSMPFLYLFFCWIAHIIYKVYVVALMQPENAGELGPFFTVGVIALVADLPLFLSIFPDGQRKWWLPLIPIGTFALTIAVYYFPAEILEPTTRKTILEFYSPFQSFWIVLALSYSTIFKNIFRISWKLSVLLGLCFIALAISQLPFVYEAFYGRIQSRVYWSVISLGIFSSILAILFFVVRDRLSGIAEVKKEAEEVKEQLKVKGEFEELGFLAASIEHELRNPLEVIIGEIDYLKSKSTGNEDLAGRFITLEKAVNRIAVAADVVNVLRSTREDIIDELKPIMASDFVSRTIKYVKRELGALTDNIYFKESESTKQLFVLAYPPLLEQAFVNILKNSVESINRSKRSGEINVDVSAGGQDTVVITFKDNGGGFVVEDIPKLVQPDYTRKEVSNSKSNRGLGLFVCDRIVSIHEGKMFFSNNTNVGGAEVKLEFPRHFTKKMQK